MNTRTERDDVVVAAVLGGSVVAAVYDRRSLNQIAPAVIDRRYSSAPEDGRYYTRLPA